MSGSGLWVEVNSNMLVRAASIIIPKGVSSTLLAAARSARWNLTSGPTEFRPGLGLAHILECLGDGAQLLWGAVLGGKGCDFRLEDFPHFLHGSEKFLRVHGSHVPGQNIAIENVPVLAGLNARANFCAGFKQAFGGERFYGFAHRRAACAIDAAPIGFVGQNGARRIDAAKYLISNTLRQLPVQIAVSGFGERDFLR